MAYVDPLASQISLMQVPRVKHIIIAVQGAARSSLMNFANFNFHLRSDRIAYQHQLTNYWGGVLQRAYPVTRRTREPSLVKTPSGQFGLEGRNS